METAGLIDGKRGRPLLRLTLAASLVCASVGFCAETSEGVVKYGVSKEVSVNEHDNRNRRTVTYVYRSPACAIGGELKFSDRNPPENQPAVARYLYLYQIRSLGCQSGLPERMGAAALLLSRMKLDGHLDTVRTIRWLWMLNDAVLLARAGRAAVDSERWVEAMSKPDRGDWKYAHVQYEEVDGFLGQPQIFEEIVTAAAALGYRLEFNSFEKLGYDKVRNLELVEGHGLPEDAYIPFVGFIWMSLSPLE